MPLAFMAPIFFGALALIGIPFLIHQIRRPEREPLRFSSLMFIPKVEKQVIERRRVQHILLMMLRMLLLVLLAGAFTRPYWRGEAPPPPAEAAGRHVILIDASLSMGARGAFDRAKSEARSVLGSLSAADRVGVVAFSSAPRTAAPFEREDDPEAGTAARARAALEEIQLTEQGTAYLPALQLAQEMLLPGDAPRGAGAGRRVVHLISDFRASGMPPKGPNWRLAPGIELNAIDVGSEILANQSIVDAAIRRTPQQELRILAKVKNWGKEAGAPAEARLFLAGQEVQKSSVSVPPGNASQVSFVQALPPDQTVEGWVEIGEDDLAADNRRYFVWTPPRKKQVLLLADPLEGEPRSAALYIERALGAGAAESLWNLTRATQANLEATLGAGGVLPDLVLACDLNGIGDATAAVLLDYAREGGNLILVLGPSIAPEVASSKLLEPAGLKSPGLRFPSALQSRFDLLAWVDLSHPIFRPFQGAKFNDFSMLRFYNYHALELPPAAAGAAPGGEGDDPAAPKVLARMEGDEGKEGAPAIVEAPVGSGRLLVWAFGVDPKWSNLPNNLKFLPLLQESLSYMTGVEDLRRTWTVGEPYRNLPRPSGDEGRWAVEFPQEEARTLDAAAMAALRDPALIRSGFLRWRSEADAAPALVDAVNVDPAESDPARVGIEEFKLKLTSAPQVAEQVSMEDFDRRGVPAGFSVESEYWRPILLLLFAFLLLEGWYAARLVR